MRDQAPRRAAARSRRADAQLPLTGGANAVPARAKVGLDLRNHGQSPHAAGMSYEAQAADVAAALSREGIDRAVVVGHSMGGKVAMHLALTQPELVGALVVVDVAPVTYAHRPGGTPSVLRAMQLADVNECATRDEVDAALERHGLKNIAMRRFVMTNLVTRADGGFSWRVALDEIVRELPQIMAFPSHPGRVYHGRTCVIRGGKSQYVPFSAMRDFTAFFPATKLVTLSDAGHWLQAEQPDTFCSTVNSFLQEEE